VTTENDRDEFLDSVSPEQLRDHIVQAQSDIDALRSRVSAQQGRIAKLESDRETLRQRLDRRRWRRTSPERPTGPSTSADALPSWTSPEGQLRVATVMDPLSRSCFAPEMGIADVTPENWQSILEQYDPQMLFVESVFNGPDRRWPGIVARYGHPSERLIEIVAGFKAAGVPTVFWNKEDPPNYALFVGSASLFDHVFTVDADMLPRYRADLGHDRVHALPFAAQPAIHYPPQDPAFRTGDVAFAGSYYRSKHADRRNQMEYVLKPALDFGLDIYDRMAGIADPRFTWPEEYQPHIRGSVPVEEMPDLYRRYKIFLNVNTVADSPTMMPRRIFELAATGTVVVSTPAEAIDASVPSEIIRVVSSPRETTEAISALLEDSGMRDHATVVGPQWIQDGHTYQHRMASIVEVL
jgi:spore maturation protein CgeB